MLDSYYQNSLALDYLRLYALEDKQIKRQAMIKVLVYPPEADDRSILQSIFSEKPDIVGFSTYLWNINRSLSIAKRVKGTLPETEIILGGVEVSYNPLQVLADNPFADAVVIGEGEMPFRQLLYNFLSGIPFGTNINGVWHRVGNEVISGGANQCVQHLDEIPSPFLSPDFDPAALTGDVLYETYRGCAFKCSYCLYHRHAGKPRFYSIGRIKKDLGVILKIPCRHIRIVDSTFNIDKRRTKEILKILKGTDKKISVEMSAEFFDEEMVELCSKSGIRHIDIGLQSATDRVLRAVNRTWHDKKAFRENLLRLSSHPEITLNLELICGLPKETYHSFRSSLDKAVGYRPDHISVYRLQVLEGSDLRHAAGQYGIQYMGGPPYTVSETASMSKHELDDMELLLFSNIVLYNTGVARLALRVAAKRYRLTPTQIYEMFTGYCLRSRVYSEKEMRTIANHYAVGNRFDRPLPKMLALDYLESVSSGFFTSLAKKQNDVHFRSVFTELVDYGYNLASLDRVEKAGEGTLSDNVSDINYPALSRLSVLESYSSDFFQTLKSAGIKISESNPYGIAFFIHNRLGPTAMDLSKDLYSFLNLCDGKHNNEEIINIMASKSDIKWNTQKYESIIQTISDLQSDLQEIGLLT
jgi:radical SAM superfamily enzyme YgiQ (UPF0313 family)